MLTIFLFKTNTKTNNFLQREYPTLTYPDTYSSMLGTPGFNSASYPQRYGT